MHASHVKKHAKQRGVACAYLSHHHALLFYWARWWLGGGRKTGAKEAKQRHKISSPNLLKLYARICTNAHRLKRFLLGAILLSNIPIVV